jgi:hypothetical protein
VDGDSGRERGVGKYLERDDDAMSCGCGAKNEEYEVGWWISRPALVALLRSLPHHSPFFPASRFLPVPLLSHAISLILFLCCYCCITVNLKKSLPFFSNVLLVGIHAVFFYLTNFAWCHCRLLVVRCYT